MESNMNNKIFPCKLMSTFYDGKSIFLTGSAGYLGSVILEVLLRCFPGIHKIYILLRQKKDVDPQTRKSVVFQKRVFEPLLNDKPDIINKVVVVSGDISLPNMGMTDKDLEMICNEVTIFFHCAATISFIKTLKKTVLQNAVGTKNAIELCRKLKNLEVLVYTSTAMSFSNYHPYIEEQVYRLPFKAQRFMEELENGTEESFERLCGLCKPNWPNNYTFSKALAENILIDCASDLPIAIVRPSIICSSYKTGYVEEGNGIVDMAVMVGKGFLRVINADPEVKVDLIPLDISANAHVVAAWSLATGRSSNPLVLNNTGGHVWTITVQKFLQSVVHYSEKKTFPQAFQHPSLKIIKNRFLYWCFALYEHYIPALVIEIMLRLKGKKTRVIPHYIFYDSIIKNYFPFMSNTYEFECNKIEELKEQIDLSEKELTYLDFKGFTVEALLEKVPNSSTIFDWSKDKKSKEEREKAVVNQTRIIYLAKNGIVLFFLWLLYFFISKIWFWN